MPALANIFETSVDLLIGMDTIRAEETRYNIHKKAVEYQRSGDYDMADRSLDSLAVKMSRRFDPGYADKREREIVELVNERSVRERVEQEIEAQSSAEKEDDR